MVGQLYFEYKDSLLPRAGRTIGKAKSSFALMVWPNGKPCVLVNTWLCDVSSRTTGQTCKQYCVNITPLIRYCGTKNVNLVDFSDEHLNDLSLSLTGEKTAAGGRKKQNNQVNAVIDTILIFYIWLRDVGSPFEYGHLIGLVGQSCNITVTTATNRFGQLCYKHEAHVEKSADLHEKHAMPDSTISILEDQVFLESVSHGERGGNANRVDADTEGSRALQIYLLERRNFSMWMFKRTGLRPAELCLMPWAENKNVLETNVLRIPTKKRRTESLALRVFKVSSDAALSVDYYLKAREAFLSFLRANGDRSSYGDVMLLTLDGGNLSAASLTRDFSRVVKRAGLADVRACLSMFRHRFITKEILLHLREIFGTKTLSRASISPPVIRSIQERIRKKTGHGLGDSIWTYFDTVFDMIELWADVDRAIENFDKIDDIEGQLKRVKQNVNRSALTNEFIFEQIKSLQDQLDKLRMQMGIVR